MSDVPIQQRPLTLLHQPPHHAPGGKTLSGAKPVAAVPVKDASSPVRLKSSLKVATLLSLKWLLVEVKMAIWVVTYAVLRERTLTRHGNTTELEKILKYMNVASIGNPVHT